MRVLAYNIQSGVRGLQWVGSVIREADPDVAFLTEVPRGAMRELSRFAGRGVRQGRWRGIDNAIFAKHGGLEVLDRRTLSRSPGLERRGLLVARAGGVTVATVHLGLVGEERLRHAREILDALPPSGPLVLAGDFNEEPDGPAMAVLSQRFTDAFAVSGEGRGETFPSSGPKHRIDYVLTSGVRATQCEVIEALAADHRPVVAEIEV